MDIDDCDSENFVIQDSNDGGGNTGARAAGSGGRRRDPDSAYIPDPDAEKDLDNNQGYTRIMRGKASLARSVSSPVNARVSKKAAPTRAAMDGREKGAKEAATRADVIELFPATAYSVWQDSLYWLEGGEVQRR
jgi:hypothetical protein